MILPKDTYIYIIQNKAGEIKIGKSDKPIKRLAQLQTGNSHKLKLLAVVKTKDKYLERRLHSMFFFHKKHGEWFNLTPNGIELLLDYLRERYSLQMFV